MARKGTGLTISQRSNGSWRAQIRKSGFPYESKDFLTHEAADDWGLRRLAEIQTTGRLVDRRPAERTSFGTAIELYIEKVTSKRRGEASKIAETARLQRFLREEKRICDHALAYLTSEMLVEWRDRRQKQTVSRGRLEIRGRSEIEVVPRGRYRRDGTLRANAASPKASLKPLKFVSPGTVKREMTLLRRVLDFAMGEFKLSTNPMNVKSVKPPAVNDERKVRISREDWIRLLKECAASRNPWLAPFVELALEVGTRRGSLIKLLWQDVHLNDAFAVLRDIKNSRKPDEIRDAEVGLSPRAIAILTALPRSLDGRVFPVTSEAIKSSFERARHRAKLDFFRLHDARHELASRLVEADWQILDLMRQCDWRDPKSASRYYNARGSHLGEKLAKLTNTKSTR